MTISALKREADHRFEGLTGGILQSAVMKRLVQLVALVAALLLAVPPALARDLCAATERADGGQQDCCATMAMAQALPEHVPGASAPDTDCGQSCCSVSSPQLPATDGQSKAKAETTTAVCTGVSVHWERSAAVDPLPMHASVLRSARSRHLLLHVFLI